MRHSCAVGASLVATVAPIVGAAVVWFTTPRPWLPLALFGVFVVWCWWARVVDPVGGFVRPLLWLLLAGMVAWNPALHGVAPWWLVPGLLLVFATHWWVALARLGTFPNVHITIGEQEPEPAPEPVPEPRRVRDFTRTSTPAPDAPIVADQHRTVHSVSRYSNVVIDDPDDDDAESYPFLAEVRRVWPQDRGKAHLTVLAERLGVSVREVRSELEAAGVTVDPACSAKQPGKDGQRRTQAGIEWSQVAPERG